MSRARIAIPVTLTLALLVTSSAPALAAGGALDPTFGIGGLVRTNLSGENTGEAYAVAVQSDGKIVVVGTAENGSNGSAASDIAVVRYNVDGSLDPSFDGDGRQSVAFAVESTDYGYAVALQSDGKIVVAGTTTVAFSGTGSDVAVVRFNTDGSLDTTFGGTGKVATDLGSTGSEIGYGVAVQSDGKIVVAGGSSPSIAVVRYNADGSLDAGFGSGGKVVTPVGISDSGYGVAIQSDGKILVAGEATFGFLDTDVAVVRYNSSGSLDTSFDADGIVTTPIGASVDRGSAVTVQGDGRIVVAGTSYNGSTHDLAVVRYDANGSLDPAFDGDGKVTMSGVGFLDARAVALQSDGKIVVPGVVLIGSNSEMAVLRLNTDGSLDGGFDGNGTATATFGSDSQNGRGVAIQSDGGIVVVGRGGNPSHFAAARFATNGSLEGTFDGDGKVLTGAGASQDQAYSVVLQGDGKAVAVGFTADGNSTDFALVRYDTEGDLDAGFGVGGKVTTELLGFNIAAQAALQGDGKIVVAGYASLDSFDPDTDFAVARYNTDGSLDSSFDGDGWVTTPIGLGQDIAAAVAVQSDGKIVVAGHTLIGINTNVALVRYLTDGTLDVGFGVSGVVTTAVGATSQASAVAVQSDGRIVVAGYSGTFLAGSIVAVRYLADGSLDPSFDGDGIVTTAVGPTTNVGRAVAVQSDGRIVVAGYAADGGGAYQVALLRYMTNGSLDPTFDGDGMVTTAVLGFDYAQALAIQPDGKLVVAGSAQNSMAVVRYLPDGALDTSFNGTGNATPGSGPAGAVVVQSDGNIIAVGQVLDGSGWDFAAARFLGCCLPPASGGTAKKIGIVRKAILAKEKCYAKAVGGAGVLPVGCIANAETKFAAAWPKTEAPGNDSLTIGDQLIVAGLVDQLVSDLTIQLGGITPASKCTGKQYGIAAKRIGAAANCQAKAIKKGIAPDARCQSKASVKFGAAWAKAEAPGHDCLTSGNVGSVGALLDRALATMRNQLVP